MASSVDNEKKASAHKTREDYQHREADMKRKHNAEVNRLHKAHADQIRELQNNHQNQLETVRLRGQESLSTQDKKYQSEIDKIRSAHKQQNINAAQENGSKIKELQLQYEGQLDKETAVNKSRQEALEENYMRNFKEKEEEYTKSVDYMRSKQEQGLIEERNRLENKYMKDGNELRKNQDSRVGDLTQELQNTKDQKNAEISNLKTRLISDREEAESEKLDLLQQERKKSSLHQNYMNEQYHENLDNLREKYQSYSMDSKSGRAEELQNLEANANKRNNDAIEALERRIRAQRVQTDMDNFERNNQFRTEKKAYLDEVKKQLDVAETQREQVYEVAKKQTREDILDITKRNNSILDRQNKYNQSKVQEMTEKYNESLDTQVHRVEIENKKDLKNEQMRSKKVNMLLTQEKNNLEAYYQEMIEENHRVHLETLNEQRANLMKERNEAIRQLENRIREMDEKNTDKMNLMAQKYEKEIFDLKEMHKADTKSLVNQYNKRIDEIEKNQKMITESDRTQASAREIQIKDKYEKQLESLRLAHEEEKIKMATRRV